MDPIMELIMQMAMGGGVLPEYSVTKGWQPVDLGTVASNVNLQQDVTQQMLDPMRAALMGFYDPQAFEPVPVEPDLPDEPKTPLLGRYSQSSDQVIQAIIADLARGDDPRRIVMKLAEGGLIEAPLKDEATGKTIESPEVDYYLELAENLGNEIYERQVYDQKVQEAQQNPQFEDSDLTKKFKAAGFASTPADQYGPQDVVPKFDEFQDNAATAKTAYEEAIRNFGEVHRSESYANAANQPQERGDSWLDLTKNLNFTAPTPPPPEAAGRDWTQLLNPGLEESLHLGGGQGQERERALTATAAASALNNLGGLGAAPRKPAEKSKPKESNKLKQAALAKRQAELDSKKADWGADMANRGSARQLRKLQARGLTPFIEEVFGRAGLK